MNGPTADGADRRDEIDAGAVREALAAHGIDVLAVTTAEGAADGRGRRVLVYLHGNAGQTNQQDAIRILRALQGVALVEVTGAAWTILRLHPTADPGPSHAREGDQDP